MLDIDQHMPRRNSSRFEQQRHSTIDAANRIMSPTRSKERAGTTSLAAPCAIGRILTELQMNSAEVLSTSMSQDHARVESAAPGDSLLTIVIPALNEEASIESTVMRCLA